jgi:hypothetical protein
MPEHSENFFGQRIGFRIASCQTKNGLAPTRDQFLETEQKQMTKQSRFHELIELAAGVDYGDFVRTSRACRPGLLAAGARYSLCAAKA